MLECGSTEGGKSFDGFVHQTQDPEQAAGLAVTVNSLQDSAEPMILSLEVNRLQLPVAAPASQFGEVRLTGLQQCELPPAAAPEMKPVLDIKAAVLPAAMHAEPLQQAPITNNITVNSSVVHQLEPALQMNMEQEDKRLPVLSQANLADAHRGHHRLQDPNIALLPPEAHLGDYQLESVNQEIFKECPFYEILDIIKSPSIDSVKTSRLATLLPSMSLDSRTKELLADLGHWNETKANFDEIPN